LNAQKGIGFKNKELIIDDFDNQLVFNVIEEQEFTTIQTRHWWCIFPWNWFNPRCMN
jgi:hypothetical protein